MFIYYFVNNKVYNNIPVCVLLKIYGSNVIDNLGDVEQITKLVKRKQYYYLITIDWPL